MTLWFSGDSRGDPVRAHPVEAELENLRESDSWIVVEIEALCSQCGAYWHCEHKPYPTCPRCGWITLGISCEDCYAKDCPVRTQGLKPWLKT